VCLFGAVGGQEGDEVLAVGLLLQAGEHHLGAGHHLLGVRYPLVNGLGVPYDSRFLDGIGIAELCVGAG